MKIIIPGVPMPLARHRDFRRNGITIRYDPSKKYKDFVKKCINDQIKNLKPSDLPLVESFDVKMTFYFPTNESDSKGQKNAKLWGFTNHATKPDGSNLIKNYEDAANGLLFHDDCMIVKGSFEKAYSDNPRTEIDIMIKKRLEISEKSQHDLCLFSPTELREFLNDVRKLATYSYQDLEVDNDDIRRQQLEAVALELGQFSEKYADIISKIKKKKPPYSTGRPIC